MMDDLSKATTTVPTSRPRTRVCRHDNHNNSRTVSPSQWLQSLHKPKLFQVPMVLFVVLISSSNVFGRTNKILWLEINLKPGGPLAPFKEHVPVTLVCSVTVNLQITGALKSNQTALTWTRNGGMPAEYNVKPSRREEGPDYITYESQLTFKPTARDHRRAFTCEATVNNWTGRSIYTQVIDFQAITTTKTTTATTATTSTTERTTEETQETSAKEGCTPELCGKHKCQTFDDVTSCSCLTGYENSSPLHCEDIDECKQPDICYNHSCINKNGSYACRCQSGFHNIVPQTCVKADVIAFQTSVQEEKSEIFLFNLRSITPAKVVACGLSSIAVGFLILAGIQCAMTIVNATATFATTKPMKGLHSRMLKKHYIDITYNEEEDSDINSDETSEETKYSDKEDKELSSSTSSTSMSYSSSTSTKPTSYNTSKSPTPKSYSSSRQSSE